MIDKQGESNISTNETKKAAVRSHIGSRTAACLLILYSFLSLGVRVTPVHKNNRLHLWNVASRWAKLKFWKIEFLQLFHSKSGALYVKTPNFRAAFSVLHLSSTHFEKSRSKRYKACSDVSGVYRKDAVAKPYATRLCWFLWGKFPFCNSNPQHLVLTDEWLATAYVVRTLTVQWKHINRNAKNLILLK